MALPIASIQQQVANPFQMALEGFYRGQQQKERDAAMELEQQQQALQQQQFQAKQQRQQEIQAAIAGYYGNPDSSSQDAARLMATYPELKDAMLEPYKNKTQDERAELFLDMAEAYTMLEGGDLEMAKASIDRRIQAAENSNKPQEADLLRYAKDRMSENPETAKKSLVAQMYAVDPDRADKWIEGMRGPDRKSYEDVYGIRRYTDTGEPVFAGETPEEALKARKAGATQVTNILPSEKAFGSEVGKVAAQELFTQRKAAQDAVSSLESISEAKRLLSDKGIISGFGANFKVGFGKALQSAGISFAEDEIANTEAYSANAAKQVAQIIKAFGSGTGLSDADREFATKAAAGDINLTEKSMRRIIDINERAAKNVIKKYNQMAGQIDPELVPFDLQVQEPILESDEIDLLIEKYAD